MKLYFVMMVLIMPALIVQAASDKPNVIVFFVDDMGYNELGCYGSPDLRTPHIDSLAKNGVRCTSGYVTAPSCGPSRAGIMTGHYQTQFGFEINPQKEFRNEFGLDLRYQTLGDRMQAAGYKTGAIGKWDLGRGVDFNPVNRGFDFYYGHIVGARNYWPAKRGPESMVVTRGPGITVKETQYLTYQLTDGAVEFIDKYKNDPFFLYVAYNAPHVPFQAPEQAIARNNHIKNEKRRLYAGMITALDDSVGRILNRLRDLKLENNTMILFISDNGSPSGAPKTGEYLDGNNDPLRGTKGTLYEGGVRVPFIVQWKAGAVPAGQTYDGMVSSLDVMPTALAIAGVKAPSGLPGVDILSFVKGQRGNTHPVEALYWRYNGYRACRVGDWKWISDPKDNIMGLFNLVTDVSEQNNLLKSQPQKATELEALWHQWNLKNVAPLWHPTSLNKLRKLYGDTGLKPLR